MHRARELPSPPAGTPVHDARQTTIGQRRASVQAGCVPPSTGWRRSARQRTQSPQCSRLRCPRCPASHPSQCGHLQWRARSKARDGSSKNCTQTSPQSLPKLPSPPVRNRHRHPLVAEMGLPLREPCHLHRSRHRVRVSEYEIRRGTRSDFGWAGFDPEDSKAR